MNDGDISVASAGAGERIIESRVVYLLAPQSVEVRTEDFAVVPGARELVCETLVSAISPGTELGAYLGLPPLRAGITYPRLQGYCNVARVLAIGGQVSGVRVGDRVLSFASHRSHFSMSVDDVLLVLRDGDRTDDVVCAYLYHLGYNAVLRSDIRAGSCVLVIGLGVLGLTSVAMASLSSADVFGLSEQLNSRRVCLSFGASAAYRRTEILDLREAMPNGLADVVIVTTNSWDDWAIALQLAASRGTIACLGFPGRGRAPGDFNPLDSQYFYAKQLRIEAVGHSPERPDARGFLRFNERDNLRYLVRLMATGRLKPNSLVSAVYPGVDIEQAYRDLLSRKGTPFTYLLRWHQE